MHQEDPLFLQELRFVAAMFRNPDLLRTYDDKLKEKHFAYPGSRILFNLISGSYRKFNEVPSSEELVNLLDVYFGSKRIPLIDQEGLNHDLSILLDLEVTPITEFELQNFIVAKELRAVTEELGKWKPDDGSQAFTKFRERIQELEILSAQGGEGIAIYPFSDSTLNHPRELIKDNYGGDPIPVGIGQLDDRLLGGVRPGELAIIVASTGAGKSLCMLNFAIHAMQQGKRVIYYALDNSQAEMLERIFAATSNVPIDDTDMDEASWVYAIKQGSGGCHTRFALVHYPPETITVGEIQRNIRFQRSMWKLEDVTNGMLPEDAGHGPDLVVVDYGDLLLPSRHREEYRLELKGIFDGLTRIAQEEKLVMYSASQGNRDALARDIVTLKHLSEAYGKAFVASVVITVCQTDEERSKSQFRMAVVKARRPESNYMVTCEVNYRAMKIYSTDIPVKQIMGSKLSDSGKSPSNANVVRTAEYGDRNPLSTNQPFINKKLAGESSMYDSRIENTGSKG